MYLNENEINIASTDTILRHDKVLPVLSQLSMMGSM